MPYGTVKVDNVTFTNNSVDATTTFSGIYAAITNNLTLSGTATAATFTGTTANFTNVNVQNINVTASLSGLAITGGTAGFTTVTGTTVTGTTANFVTVSGTTVTGNTGQFTTLTGGAAGFTSVTGTTVTGTTANFVTVSGTTVTGTTARFVSGIFTSLSGATHTITSGVFGNIILNGQGDLQFADADSSNWVAFQAPTTIAANVTWTLPSADGSNSQALSTNGSGTLSWASFATLTTAQSFSAAQRGTISALTDGATITADFAVANNFSVTLGGNRTLANPSNLTAGQSGAIWITQDGTGSRTLAYGSYWDFTGGTAPTLTTTASARDCLVYAVQSSTQITATLITNLS